MMAGRTAADLRRSADGGNDRSNDDRSQHVVTDPEASIIRGSGRFHESDGTMKSDDRRANSLVRTFKFVYHHSTALVPVSLLWVVCSLPLVTIGPVSLGVYASVVSVKETGRVDRERVIGTIRENLGPSILLGLLPFTFVGIGALYTLSGVATGLLGTILGGIAMYVGLYLGVLLIPTFVSMSTGANPGVALRESYVWLAGSPVTGLQLGLVTIVLFVATLGLSVAFLLLFAGIAATYHVEVITRETAGTPESLSSFTPPEG